jgi:orotate phosphoribosyltransferase
MSFVGQMIAEAFHGWPVEAVVTPPGAVAVLGHFTAIHLRTVAHGSMPRPYTYHAEQDADGGLRFHRSYAQAIAGKRILIVNDVLIAGTLTRQLAGLVRGAGGIVAGVGTMCNRGEVTPLTLGIADPETDGTVPKFASLASIPFRAWSEKECELCRQDVPVRTDIGRGAEYLARRFSRPTEGGG